MNRRRVYLDHAATSWPKADEVLSAMDDFARNCGAAAGRGGYQSAAVSGQTVSLARRAISTLIGAPDARWITLHSNGTAALNAAIHGVVRPGDQVVTSASEHNSVLRPLYHLQQHHGVALTVIPVNSLGVVDADEMVDAVTEQTRLVALTHASNVTGSIQPIAEVGSAVRDSPAIFLCDAAQTFGTVPIDVAESCIDLLATPGHKASGGPLGTAFLYVSPDIESTLSPPVQGGTGSQSESLEMPTTLPSMLEAGNLNVPAIAGWNQALKSLQACNWNDRISHSAHLAKQLHEGLASVESLRVIGKAGPIPIASVIPQNLSPTDFAAILDAEFGVEARAGMHCAALVHDCIDSHPEGTLRLSAGHTTADEDIQYAVDAMRSIAAAVN